MSERVCIQYLHVTASGTTTTKMAGQDTAHPLSRLLCHFYFVRRIGAWLITLPPGGESADSVQSKYDGAEKVHCTHRVNQCLGHGKASGGRRAQCQYGVEPMGPKTMEQFHRLHRSRGDTLDRGWCKGPAAFQKAQHGVLETRGGRETQGQIGQSCDGYYIEIAGGSATCSIERWQLDAHGQHGQ